MESEDTFSTAPAAHLNKLNPIDLQREAANDSYVVQSNLFTYEYLKSLPGFVVNLTKSHLYKGQVNSLGK